MSEIVRHSMESEAEARQPKSALAESAGSAMWLPMETAPKDGTEILLRLHHANRKYVVEYDQHYMEATVLAKWIEHNGGGWTWSGMSGNPVGWMCAPLHPVDDPNHVHHHDCGYTVTGHIHNCDCEPNAPLELQTEQTSPAPVPGSASVLHIWYRRENGEAVGLQVGGIASDDAIHAIRSALDEGAVAVTIIRETVRMQNTRTELTRPAQ